MHTSVFCTFRSLFRPLYDVKDISAVRELMRPVVSSSESYFSLLKKKKNKEQITEFRAFFSTLNNNKLLQIEPQQCLLSTQAARVLPVYLIFISKTKFARILFL